MKRFALLCFLILPVWAFAQEGSIAIIEYIGGEFDEVKITTPFGEQYEGEIGMELELESTIQTGEATVEIRLEPNGTILNLGENTFFELTSIQGRRSSEETVLTLIQGRLRTVAARMGIDNRYSIKTPTAVCGIRGTEILNVVSSTENLVLCKSGSVEVINSLDATNRVLIGANQQVNTAQAQFTPLTIPSDEVSAMFESLPFLQLNPDEVPRQGEPQLAAAEEEPESTDEEEIQEDEQEEVEEESAETEEETPVETAETSVVAQAPEESAESPMDDGQPSPFEQWMRESMGFEIGAVNIDGLTWSKVILQPVFQTETFSLGLYLPFVYRENILDPTDWHKPEGNNEWSFGSDQEDVRSVFKDMGQDLWLKLRYFEYGDAQWDPIYAKAGNLNSLTIGFGSLVDNYSNNTNFPSVRKVGVNAGFRSGGTEVEGLLDDLADPTLVGLRVRSGMENGFGVGISAVADFYPFEDYTISNPMGLSFGNPYVLATSLDFQVFRIDEEALKLVAYADVSTILPIFREEPDAIFGVEKWNNPLKMIWDGSKFQNYGATAGFTGKASIMDFTVNLRFAHGVYQHNLFNNFYDRNRSQYAMVLFSERSGLSNTETKSLALYGEGGFSLLADKLHFTAGYLWPWEIDGSSIKYSDFDYIKLGLELKKGIIPAYNISGAFYYERYGLIPTLRDQNFKVLNTQTVLSGEVVMPLASTLDLALIASTSTAYDDQGNLILDSDGEPKIIPVFNIETRIHF